VRHERIVLGYHGCDRAIAEKLLAGEPFRPSRNPYDWLGSGVYFWEYAPDRALRFAYLQKQRGNVRHPAYVGAELRLGRCFDLLDTRFTYDLASFYPVWRATLRRSRVPLPSNTGAAPYFMKRFRDCALMNEYLTLVGQDGVEYDTVRGCFLEGARLFPKSGFYRESHVQIAVRNAACVIRVFDPILEGHET
jgi:hypothetical protein